LGPRVGQQYSTFRLIPVVNVLVQEAAHTAPRPQFRHGRKRTHFVVGSPSPGTHKTQVRSGRLVPHRTITPALARARARAGQAHAPGPCLAYCAHRPGQRLSCFLHSAISPCDTQPRGEPCGGGGGKTHLFNRIWPFSPRRGCPVVLLHERCVAGAAESEVFSSLHPTLSLHPKMEVCVGQEQRLLYRDVVHVSFF